MFLQPFTTGQSKVAAGGMILLLLALPIINSLLDNERLTLVLNYIVAILIGCALGWVAGDAFTHASNKGKAVTAVASVVIAILTNIGPVTKALRDAGQSQQGSFLYELFVRPFQRGSVTGSFQYATLAFLLTMLLAIFYINTADKAAGGHPKP